MEDLQHFTLRGLDLALPGTALRGGVGPALQAGRYERNEADALEKHLLPSDRFVDFGAGIGFLCALAARVVGAAGVSGVEAGPRTIEMARGNLDRNGFPEVRLFHGAVTAVSMPAGTVRFGQRPAFWASALKAGEDWPANAEVVEVPALPAAHLLADLQPTVLSCDIEGAEREVLAVPMPASLRLIITEIHPAIYGGGGTKEVFDALSAQGFAYEPEGSRGATVVFRRIG